MDDLYVCPRTGGALRDWHSAAGRITYPVLDGVPILVGEPFRYSLRRKSWHEASMDAARAPDAITPHLPAHLLGAPGGMGQWFAQLQDNGADAMAAALGARWAPDGPAVDIGCGMAPMARRMATLGRLTYAFDVDLDAVIAARTVLTMPDAVAPVPTHKAAFRRVKVPFKPLTRGLAFCVADATSPPFARGSFAWAHLGDVLDHCGDAVGEVLVAASELVMRNGVLSITTSYSTPRTTSENRAPPEEELLEALEGLGMQVVEQSDRVPHVLRHYDRSFHIRFMHVIVARRRG